MPLYLFSRECSSFLFPVREALSRSLSLLTIRHHDSQNGTFAQDVSVLRIRSRGPVKCARAPWLAIVLHLRAYKLSTHAHTHTHAFSRNKMEPYQLDKLLCVKSNTKSLSYEDSTEEHRSSTVWYGCFI